MLRNAKDFHFRDSRVSGSANPASASVYDNVKVILIYYLNYLRFSISYFDFLFCFIILIISTFIASAFVYDNAKGKTSKFHDGFHNDFYLFDDYQFDDYYFDNHNFDYHHFHDYTFDDYYFGNHHFEGHWCYSLLI